MGHRDLIIAGSVRQPAYIAYGEAIAGRRCSLEDISHYCEIAGVYTEDRRPYPKLRNVAGEQ